MSLTVHPTCFASQVDKRPKGYAVFSGEWDVGRRAARSGGSRHARSMVDLWPTCRPSRPTPPAKMPGYEYASEGATFVCWLHAIHDALGARSIRDKPAEMHTHEALRSRTRHGEASGMPSR